MKHKLYKRLLAPAFFMLALGAIAIVGCGSSSVTNQENGKTTEGATAEDAALGLEKPAEGEFLLKGKMEGETNQLLVLQKLEQGQLSFIDSTRTDDKGKYEFKGSAERKMFYYVTINSMQPPGVPVLLENGSSVQLDLSMDQYIETSVKGDAENQKLKELYDLYLSHNKANVDLQTKYGDINPRSVDDSTRNAISAEFMDLQKRMSEEIEQFVKENKGGPATYFAAMYVVGDKSPTLWDEALKKLKADDPESLFTKRLEDQINSKTALEIGGLAPEIALNSPEGQVVKLSSLRGNVVLIDFWASWCRPCRAENPNVVRMYNKYHDQGFEVYSVSLDNNASRWQTAIQQDGLTWTHVSDLKGWKSSAAALYKVSSIPQTFLLDKNGRIIGKNLRGPQLEAKLAELFN